MSCHVMSSLLKQGLGGGDTVVATFLQGTLEKQR